MTITVLSIEEHVKDVTNNRSNKFADNPPWNEPKIKAGDYIFIWRDKHRCLGPARFVNVGTNIIKYIHGDETLTPSFNRVQRTIAPIHPIFEDDEEITPSLPSVSTQHDKTETSCQDNCTDNQVYSAPSITRQRSQKFGNDRTKRESLKYGTGNRKEIIPLGVRRAY